MDPPVSTSPGVDAMSPGARASGPRLLPSPVPLDCYELRAVIGQGTAAIVYLGTDRTLRVPVAVREYIPQGLAGRDGASRVVPLSPAHERSFARGLEAFIEEARMLARCDHPSFLRIVRLLEANGTAYSVMPHYVGRPLTDVRRDANAAFDESQLRALLDDLLGALEAFHAFGRVHGGVSPDNVLLLQNGRPLLLRPRAPGRGTSGEPIDTLTRYLNIRDEPAASGAATETWTDVRDAARVIRFLMESGGAGHDKRYSGPFLEALDAAESPLPERRPRSVGEFRAWLKGLSEPERGPAAETILDFHPAPTAEAWRPAAASPIATPPTAGRPDRDAPAETVAPAIPERATSGREAPTRRMVSKSVVLLAILAVPAMVFWLLNRPPVAVQGWSKALVPPSLTPSRNAPNPGATAVATLPEAGSKAPSPALEGGGGWAGTAPDAAPNGPQTVGDLATPAAPIMSPSSPAPEGSEALARTGDAAAPSLPAAAEQPRPAVAAAPVLVSPKRGSPREFCAPRTQFALYRCMQAQCSTPKWSQHAQCIRLRATDDVD